jgi:segregation and condensation protein A
MTIHYKLESFEGPLDLLLHLIDKAELDIYEIPISEITDQYLEYIGTMQELELNLASEFLVMAATLLSIKSKMLLPKPPASLEVTDDEDDDSDPRAELVKKLIEYRKYKGIADHLRDQELARSLIYSKEPADLTSYVPEQRENPVLGLHVADLVVAFRKAMSKSNRRESVAKIRRDEISVSDRIRQLLGLLGNHTGGKLLFSKLFAADHSREEIVVTFLAVLELMKMKKISCYQHSLFDDIVISYMEGGAPDGFSTDEIDY